MVIVFANQKGGVGKTTTTVNIGAYMAQMGKRVLLIDFDPQGNLSSALGIRNFERSVYNLILGMNKPQEILQKSPQENLDVLPANLHLSGATVELAKEETVDPYFYLKKAIAPLLGVYDYILIDCPPSLGILTVNGLAAADRVIIPLQCEYFSLEGLKQMYSITLQRIQRTINKGLKLGGIIFTMYDTRTNLGKEVISSVKNSFVDNPSALFKTVIPRNIRLSEAPSHGVPINLYDPSCIGAKCYEKLAQEVIEGV